MPPPAATPALLQITWTLPNAAKVACAARSTLAASVTSQALPSMSGVISRRLSTALPSASVSISAIITFMPAPAKARAIKSPTPPPPPVTKAVLPASSRMAASPVALPYLHEAATPDSEFGMTLPRTLVFDLDGTLVDTAPDLIAALNYVLDREGLPPVPLDKARNMIGAGARKLLERGLEVDGRAVSVGDLDRLTKDFIDFYADHIADASRPFEGLEAALDQLQGLGF